MNQEILEDRLSSLKQEASHQRNIACGLIGCTIFEAIGIAASLANQNAVTLVACSAGTILTAAVTLNQTLESIQTSQEAAVLSAQLTILDAGEQPTTA